MAPNSSGLSPVRTIPPHWVFTPKNSSVACLPSSPPTRTRRLPLLLFRHARSTELRAQKEEKQISVAARHLRCPIPFLTVTLELTTYDCYDCLSLPHGTGCLRASHSSLKRRTVSRRRTASVAIVSSRCSPPLGILPSCFLRTSVSRSSAFLSIPVNGLFSSCRSTSPKSSSTLSI